MNRSSRRLRFAVLAAALSAGLLAPTAPAGAEPDRAPQPEPAQREAAQRLPIRGERAPDPKAGDVFDRRDVRGYPRQQVLPEPPVNESDAAIKLGLAPYHSIAPTLNDLQAASERVSVEIIGESARGHDLYLVTLTSPESRAKARRQALIRDRIKDRAEQSARDRRIPRTYKAPIFVNNNIHGNEFEGTDASLRIIEDYATSDDVAVENLLDTARLYFVVTMNPDGRIGNTRANGNGFDMNRDFITGTQSEVRAVRQALIDTQSLVMLDMHGYVNGTLIEPTTPPHGENYEYDLFIKHAYPNGLAMEEAVNGLGYTPEADGVLPAQIPFRDDEEGWDDWPPIFTPQYAAFHGTVSHTIEIPLRVNNRSYDELPVDELRRRSAINTDVAEAAIRAAIAFTDENRAELIADQIEIFRRGEAGEAQRPVTPALFPEIGPEDVYTTDFPRAYVIPRGSTQRSAVAAARLVDHLVANDVEVLRTDRAFRADGQRYRAGSYVVDMHQPKRGLANVILAAGSDISDRVDQMYDISGWSLGLLWGATVDIVEHGGLSVQGREVAVAAPTGAVRGRRDLSLRLDDPKDFQALDALLDADAEVGWTDDGSLMVDRSARPLARELADRFGVVFRRATGPAGTPLDDVVVAAAAPADEQFALVEMGFDVRPISTAVLNAGFDWSEIDSLFVSGGLSYSSLSPAARASLREFLSSGGVVTRGGTGATFNSETGLLTATRVAGRSDANGVIRVRNSGGPLTSRATPHSFVSAPSWFIGLGGEVDVEQRYGTTGPLVSGHWRPDGDGTGGQEAARGQAVVIRGVDETGAGVVMFGSEPLYRAHPKGQYALAGRALIWSTTEPE